MDTFDRCVFFYNQMENITLLKMNYKLQIKNNLVAKSILRLAIQKYKA